MSQSDLLIDRFVEKVNSSPREPLWPDDVPPALRIGSPDEYGCFDWQIQRSDTINWITLYEEGLPARLAPTFRSLVTRYIYPELEIGDFWLFANTGIEFDHEWRTAVDVNKLTDGLTPMLIANGYIQFARPFEPANGTSSVSTQNAGQVAVTIRLFRSIMKATRSG